MIRNSEDKMLKTDDYLGTKVTNTNKVWFCINCKRYRISKTIPTSCPCHNGMFVIDTNKRVE